MALRQSSVDRYENSLIPAKTYIFSNPKVLTSCSGSLFLVKGLKISSTCLGKNE